MHRPVVTDNYIAAKMLIQLHLMSLWTFNWPIHHFWSFGLDCSILPAAPTYSTYNVQHHCAMSLQHSMSLWTFNWPIHHLLVIWPGLQYITCSTYLQCIQCTAPLCNVTAALNCRIYSVQHTCAMSLQYLTTKSTEYSTIVQCLCIQPPIVTIDCGTGSPIVAQTHRQ